MAEIASVAFVGAVGGETGGGTLVGGAASGSAVVGAGVGVALVVGYVAYDYYTEPFESSRLTEEEGQLLVPATAAAETYEYDGRTITLPQGGIQKGYDPRVGQEIVHGFGWALIAEQTELSKDEIGEVFASEPVSRQPGEIEYVIGEIVSKKDAVILSILGGFLLAGQEARSVTDGTDECREVGYTDDKVEHASRDEKGIDHSDVLDAISNPDSFGEGKSLYYIRKIEGKGWYVVRVLKDVPFKFADKFKYWMSTSLIDQRTGDLYESLDDAKDAMEDEDEDVTWNDDPRGCN